MKFWLALAFAIPFWCLALYANGLYQSMRTRTYLEILWAVIKSAVVTFLLLGTVIFLLKLTFMSRFFFLLFMSFGFLFIWLEKTVIFMSSHYVRRQGLNTRRLLIVGTGKRAVEFIKKADHHPEWGFELLGAIDDEPGRGIQRVERLDVLGSLADIPRIFHRDAIDEVVFVVPRSRLNSLQGAIDDCETEGVMVTVAVDLFDTKLARSSIAELDGLPLLHFKTTHAKEWELLIKRLFDFVASGLGIMVLSPLFLVMAVLIKATSKGPGLLQAEPAGPGRPPIHALQVPDDAPGRPRRPVRRDRPPIHDHAGIPGEKDELDHARRTFHEEIQHRRAASALQRLRRSHEHRRPPADGPG